LNIIFQALLQLLKCTKFFIWVSVTSVSC
jgi:hypothetical protein